MNKLMVDGHPSLYRDTNSGAIVNNNSYEYESYMKSYQLRQKKSERIDKIENDLQNLKSDINEIKTLLVKLNERTPIN
jgi:predicted transcriptional regulator